MATEPHLGSAGTLAVKRPPANIFARATTTAETAPVTEPTSRGERPRRISARQTPHRRLVAAVAIGLATVAVAMVLVPGLAGRHEHGTEATPAPLPSATHDRHHGRAESLSPTVRHRARPRPKRESTRRGHQRRRQRFGRPSRVTRTRLPDRSAAPSPPTPVVPDAPAPTPAPTAPARPAPSPTKPEHPVPARVPDGAPPEFL